MVIHSMRGMALILLVQIAAAQSAPDIMKARTLLTSGSQDGDPEVRREVALSFGLLGRKEPAVQSLRKLMTDNDVQVRVAAVGSAADLGDRTVVPLLQEALGDSVPEVAFGAAKALWALKQPDGKDALLSVLEGQTTARSNYFRLKYRNMLRAFSTPKGALLFALNQGVGFVPLPGIGEGFSALQALLWESDFSPRASVAILLAKERDTTTRNALIEALADGDWSVRAAAAQSIGMRGQPDLRGRLVPLFTDGNSKVRYRAAASFLRLSEQARGAGAIRNSKAPAIRH